MSSINFLGAASGLPLNELVKTFVEVERQTKMARIDKTKKTLDASLSGVSQLKSALSSFQDSTKKLTSSNLKSRAVSITQPEEGRRFVEASVQNTASASRFDIKVNQLATGSRLESTDGLFSEASSVIATTDGNLTFSADGSSFTIAVSAGMTLNELRLKINESSDNFGVNANILNVGGAAGAKLVLTSNVTGAGNDLVISNDNSELDSLSTVPTGAQAGLNLTSPAQNAEIELDGILVSNETNVFNNVVQDVSLTILSETPVNKSATIDIAPDKNAAQESIQEFIKSYNALVDKVSSLTRSRILGSDGEVTLEGGALVGDSLPRNIMNALRGVLGSTVADVPEGLNSLFALGISLNKDGKLEISTSTEFSDETGQMRFDKALNENYDDIAALFGGSGGLVGQLESVISQYTQRDGILDNRQDALRSQLRENAKASEAANRYIESFESSLRKRYAALDAMLGQMQRQQDNVTAALANLPGFNRNSKN